ncbi:RNA polymerase sigma-70 factor [Fluviicola sp.]|uniref:RNA polymerase sigma factor n=1 Tax=Fluviicola sp. TaxID=1917219 RepID=UPI0031E25734
MATASNNKDLQLLQKLKDGSQLAFEELYGKYSKQMLWKLRQMVKDPDDADELLQDLFVKIWEKREQVSLELSFEAYLYRIVQHIAIDYLRKLSRQAKLYEQVQLGTTEITDDTMELLQAKETQNLLDEAVSLLPEQRRLAFTLCKIEGKSHKEAAEIMKISPNTVHNHLVKAVGAVRDHLEKSGKELVPLALLVVFYSSN